MSQDSLKINRNSLRSPQQLVALPLRCPMGYYYFQWVVSWVTITVSYILFTADVWSIACPWFAATSQTHYIADIPECISTCSPMYSGGEGTRRERTTTMIWIWQRNMDQLNSSSDGEGWHGHWNKVDSWWFSSWRDKKVTGSCWADIADWTCQLRDQRQSIPSSRWRYDTCLMAGLAAITCTA